VESHDSVLTGNQVREQRIGQPHIFQCMQQRIDHHIPHEPDTLFLNAFCPQVRITVPTRREA
jgi:hypothetical protein